MDVCRLVHLPPAAGGFRPWHEDGLCRPAKSSGPIECHRVLADAGRYAGTAARCGWGSSTADALKSAQSLDCANGQTLRCNAPTRDGERFDRDLHGKGIGMDEAQRIEHRAHMPSPENKIAAS